jgi:hypothetical protein
MPGGQVNGDMNDLPLFPNLPECPRRIRFRSKKSIRSNDMPLDPSEEFVLSKSIWSHEDFDQMGWHDVHIHALAFSNDRHELLMDIDYMFARVSPEPPDPYFTFWIAPCTLVFSGAHSFVANIEHGFGLEIFNVSREEPDAPVTSVSDVRHQEWRWLFDCQEGQISFMASGYQQITRAKPIRGSQIISWDDRRGISFERVAYDEDRRVT